MKLQLHELIEAEYLEHGNERCSLNVETVALQERFGHLYHGETILYGGVSGRISDIPCYLGGYEVIRFSHDVVLGDVRLDVTI